MRHRGGRYSIESHTGLTPSLSGETLLLRTYTLTMDLW